MTIRISLNRLIFLYLMAMGMPDASQIYFTWEKDPVLKEYPKPKASILDGVVNEERKIIEKQIYGTVN
jgi:hypothetical protein